MNALRIRELLEELVATECFVDGEALVQIGERSCEFVMCVDTVSSPDFEDEASVLTLG